MTGVPLFSTHGCRLNAYESEAMRELAQDAGLQGAVVVNTCAVTAEAVRKSRQDIRRLRRENPEARLVVTGCAAQIDPDGFAAMPEVDQVLGNAEKLRPEVWRRAADPAPLAAAERCRVDDIMSVGETAGHLIDGFGTRARAYVQVQTGCDHRCTFCVIPYGRGNSRSVPAGEVTAQIARLADRGYREVVLTGVDLTSWGADLAEAPRLGDLVGRILRSVPDLPRLRLSSVDGVEVDPALAELIGGERRLMPHLHLSLQAGDDLILKRMKRRHSREDAIAFCAEMRARRPEIVFGADLIAGFPTESDAAFERSLDLVDACGLTWLHVFPYSARPGTPAARMPQLPGGVVRDRAARLRAKGAEAAARHASAQVGRPLEVLMEGPETGRCADFTEIGLSRPRPEAVGTVVAITASGAEGGRLLA